MTRLTGEYGEIGGGAVRMMNDLPAGAEVLVDPLFVGAFYSLTGNAVWREVQGHPVHRRGT